MTNPGTCQNCGAPLADPSQTGACPRCLLEAGLTDSRASGSGGPEDPTPGPEAIQALFPQFEVLELVGRGGMGIVYKARQMSLDRLVALKILPAEVASAPGFSERFAREARTMARLDHANIVRIHEFGETDGLYFLVMEYVDGSNLRQVLDTGGLEPREALRVVPQICDALQYAHDRGIVHRDIKPENVLLDQTGRVKITDFGLAKLLDRSAYDHTITGAGQVMGTPQYMAPEQYRTPGDVDHRADIYSLGVVFYEMLTGDLPMGRFDPPSEKVEVDVRLDDVVLRTLARERERRYQRVAELRTEVDSIATSAPPRRRVRPPRPPQPIVEEPRLSRLAIAGFLCVVLAIPLGVAIVVFLLTTGGGGGVALPFVAPLLVFPVPLALLVGFGLSLAGWIQISRSEGRLRGLGFAIAGTILSLPVGLFGVVGVRFLLLGEASEPPVAMDPPRVERFEVPSLPPLPDAVLPPVPDPEPVAEAMLAPAGRGPRIVGLAPDADHAAFTQKLLGIEDFWAAVQDVARQPRIKPADFEPFVARVDEMRGRLARPGDVVRLMDQDLLGAPYLRFARGFVLLAGLRIEEIDLHRGMPLVTLTVRSPWKGYVFEIIRDGDAWHFAVGPVRRLETTSSGSASVGTRAAKGPHRVEGGPPETTVDQRWELRSHVEILWSIVQRYAEAEQVPPRARVPESEMQWLLPPSLRDTHWGTPGAELLERGRDGELGLLFLNPRKLPVPFADYAIASIVLAEDGQSAIVTAEAGEETLSFPVVREQGRWWLSLDPIER